MIGTRATEALERCAVALTRIASVLETAMNHAVVTPKESLASRLVEQIVKCEQSRDAGGKREQLRDAVVEAAKLWLQAYYAHKCPNAIKSDAYMARGESINIIERRLYETITELNVFEYKNGAAT